MGNNKQIIKDTTLLSSTLCRYIDNTHVALYVGTGLTQAVLSGLY